MAMIRLAQPSKCQSILVVLAKDRHVARWLRRGKGQHSSIILHYPWAQAILHAQYVSMVWRRISSQDN